MEKFHLMIYFYLKGLSQIFYVAVAGIPKSEQENLERESVRESKNKRIEHNTTYLPSLAQTGKNEVKKIQDLLQLISSTF